jgi:hypothetical protein
MHWVQLNTGKYKGMQVTADFFAVENIGDKWSWYTLPIGR